jgi:hypothetical protein
MSASTEVSEPKQQSTITVVVDPPRGDPASLPPQAPPAVPRLTPSTRVADTYSAFAGSALVSAWLAPLIAGFATAAVFLGWRPFMLANAVAIGIVVGVVAWLLIAIGLAPVLASPTVESDSWDQASRRLEGVRQRLARLDPIGCGRLAGLVEARASVDYVDSHEFRHPGVRWATRHGHVVMWSSIHAAEAALILSASRAEVWGTLQKVRLRLDGASKEVADRLKTAVEDIANYLENATPSGPNLNPNVAPAQPSSRLAPTDLGLPPVASEDDARGRLRQVVITLDAFVDQKYSGLVRLRNLTLIALCFTELFAFVLLALAVSSSGLPRNIVLTCFLYFIVAAVFGFLGRLLTLASTTDPTMDYGLERARLLIVPVVSGLAGLAGVLLTAMLFSMGFSSLVTASVARVNSPGSLPNLTEVFSLTTNRAGLLFAILFGYAPTLLQTRLDSLVESYKLAIKSTDPALDQVGSKSNG